MNFFELFQILFATHFVLGIYPSLLVWRFIPEGAAIWYQPVASASEIVTAMVSSLLSALWYFIWCGSLRFAVRGDFPGLSPRAFCMLVGCLYGCVGYTVYFNSTKRPNPLNEMYLFAIVAMLLLSGCGTLFLPGLKRLFDQESALRVRERDRKMDELYPWPEPSSQESLTESSGK